MKTSVVHARIEPQTKQKAEEVLRKLGLTPTEAIRIFYRQISLRGGLPFSVAIPNKLTASTLEEEPPGRRHSGIRVVRGNVQGLGEMKKVSQTRQFSRDVKRMRKRGKDLEKLQEIVKLLAEGTPLPPNLQRPSAHGTVAAITRLPH